MTLRKMIAVILLLLGAIAVCEAQQGTDSTVEQLYKKNCAACHGERGDGDSRAKFALSPPPRNFTTAQAFDDLSRQRMIISVTYGRPGTAMMSFQTRLNTQQIADVVNYIREMFMRAQGPSSDRHGLIAKPNRVLGADVINTLAAQQVANSMKKVAAVDLSLAFPHGLTGDPDLGRIFYMNNCFTCHGKAGDGTGPRALLITPRPRNFLSEDTQKKFNRPVLFKAISMGKLGTVMPAWSKVLDQQQVADVAEFVFQQFILPDVAVKSDQQKKKHLNPYR